MRHLSWVVLVAALCALPMTAKAGFVIEGSVGSGIGLKPNAGERIPTSVMLAPGYGLGEWLRLELGFMAALGDVEGGKFDLELRPMLVLDPPIFPLYLRAIAAVTGILDGETVYALGGAVGVGGSLLGLGVFAEVGVVPRFRDTVESILEGRVGAYYAF